MAFKGFNSVLFEFNTVVDKKLSLINWFNIRHNGDIKFFNKEFIKSSIESLKVKRILGIRDILVDATEVVDKDDPSVHETCKVILDSAWNDYEEDLLNHAVITDIPHLLRGYLMAGDGTIKGTVRCDTQAQADFITRVVSKDTPVIVTPREEVDMAKYTRLVIGEYFEAYQYKLYEPKSILIANYRENFHRDNITLLNPELVINLGDINDIAVIAVYRNEITPEG